MWVVVSSAGADNHPDEMDVYGDGWTEQAAKLWARARNKENDGWRYTARKLNETAKV